MFIFVPHAEQNVHVSNIRKDDVMLWCGAEQHNSAMQRAVVADVTCPYRGVHM